MIKAFIVDDEHHCCKTLVTMITRYCPQVEITGIFNSAHDALLAIEKATPQLLFLDIEMPEMNGFELLEQLALVNFELVFTTSYDQYAIRAFHFSALDYLLKPIDREELQKAVQKVVQRQVSPLPQQIELLLNRMNQPATPLNKIALPTLEGLQMVTIDTIISCSSEGNYTAFHCKGQRKLIVCRILKEVEEMLDNQPFARVHNSFLVNLNEIEKYIKGEGGYLVMSDGSCVDVSRSRKQSLLKRLSPGQV